MDTDPVIPPPVLPPPVPALPAGASVPARVVSPGRQFIVMLLNLCVALFLADAVVSVLDETLIILADVHWLSVLRGFLFLFSLLLLAAVYGLMGLTPLIPKRWFLPVVLFHPVATLLAIPAMIYGYEWMHQIAWGLSLVQAGFGFWVLRRLQSGAEFRWLPVSVSLLGDRRFSWRNLLGFVLGNVVVLLPVVMAYLALCANLAVDHFSEGFLALRPSGLTVEVRKYVRQDGKTIQLYPMMHVGETDFYRQLTQAFPTNSLILMEGVTDDHNLLTNRITYQRMAKSLGVAEQQKEFKPQAEMVRADLDVSQFHTNTIELLNFAMLIHSKGVNAETVTRLLQFSSPNLEAQLMEDLLKKRNRRLLEEIRTRLPEWNYLVIPWGAAHIPEIAREIQQAGFRVTETREYVVLRFGPGKAPEAGKQRESDKVK